MLRTISFHGKAGTSFICTLKIIHLAQLSGRLTGRMVNEDKIPLDQMHLIGFLLKSLVYGTLMAITFESGLSGFLVEWPLYYSWMSRERERAVFLKWSGVGLHLKTYIIFLCPSCEVFNVNQHRVLRHMLIVPFHKKLHQFYVM